MKCDLKGNPNNPVVILRSRWSPQKAERIGEGKGLNYSSYLKGGMSDISSSP